MAKKKTSIKSKDYFGLSWIVSLILAIFPLTSWICGVIVRLQEGKIVSAIIRLFGGFNIIWILDIICMIFKHKICRLLTI